MHKNVLLAIVILLGCGLLILGLVNKPGKMEVVQDQTWEEVEEIPQEQEKQEVATPEPAKKTYEDALNRAKKEDKHVLLLFVADWCDFCKRMEATWQDEDVKKAMEKYVVYTVNTDKERSLALQYEVSTIPAYVIINNEEKVLKKDKGFKGSRTFERWLKIGVRKPGWWRNPRG